MRTRPIRLRNVAHLSPSFDDWLDVAMSAAGLVVLGTLVYLFVAFVR